MRLAVKFKGPERLALVTDCNRALDLPDGEYMFGPLEGGARFVRRDGGGIMPDGSALASGCMGMDHMVRTCYDQSGASLDEVGRMASATPATILRRQNIGSLAKGKFAEVLLLNEDHIRVYCWKKASTLRCGENKSLAKAFTKRSTFF